MATGIIKPYQTRGDLRLKADVVVVGSGAGGATAATTLAEAGLDVIVLEEGGHYETHEYSAHVPEMMGKLMRDGGSTVILGRSPITYFEGRCVGGSTVINGGMCWRTPDRILSEWHDDFTLPDMSPDVLNPIFEHVEDTINARHQDPGSEGECNHVFRKGAEALGWTLNQNKRNQIHCVGSNDCITGCPSGGKQSTLYSWLPRFFRADGRVYTKMKVERVETDGRKATGVSGVLLDPYRRRRFTVTASAVVLACGAVQTPLLLQKNRLAKDCGRVGRHFTIHPNVKVAALFDEDIDSMRGTHQAWQCTEFADEGILLAPGAVPLAFLSAVMDDFGAKLSERMRDHRMMATGGVLVDDYAEGRIKTLPFGIPYVKYDVTDVDQAKFMKAAAKLAELYFAAGAREVFTAFHSVPVLHSADDIKKIYDISPRVEDTEYFTAHIMGTCRMHSDPKQGVVGPDGQAFDVPGLYITDASVMPGTVGVNPQVTIMALARLISGKLARRLNAQRAA